MSLVRKQGCEYADGGLGSLVPIEEAILRGATEVDVVVLHTEVNYYNRMPSRNPFELITNMLSFVLDRTRMLRVCLFNLSFKNKV
jgi:predicted patatin/cPLA2 family phospholipase